MPRRLPLAELRRELQLRLRVERELWRSPRWPAALLFVGAPAGLLLWILASAGGTPERSLAAGATGTARTAAGEGVGPSAPPRSPQVGGAGATGASHAALAEELLERDWLADAAGEFRQAIAAREEPGRGWLGLARVAARAERPAAALAVAERAAREQPADAGALRTLAAAQARAGQSAAAVRTFARVLEVGEPGAATLQDAAAASALAGDWDGAATRCRRAAAAARQSGTAVLGPRLLLAAILSHQGRRGAALRELERAARDHPWSPAALLLLGRARLQQGQDVAAAASFEQASRLEPAWPVPVLAAGFACLQAGRLDEAARHYTRAQQLAPDAVAPRIGLAQLGERLGDRRAAIREYEAILARQPNHLLALNNLACAYAEEGRELDRALALARRAVGVSHYAAQVLDTLGYVCLQAGQPREAALHLREALRRAPHLAAAREHLAQAERAEGSTDAGHGPGSQAAR